MMILNSRNIRVIVLYACRTQWVFYNPASFRRNIFDPLQRVLKPFSTPRRYINNPLTLLICTPHFCFTTHRNDLVAQDYWIAPLMLRHAYSCDVIRRQYLWHFILASILDIANSIIILHLTKLNSIRIKMIWSKYNSNKLKRGSKEDEYMVCSHKVE